MKVRIFAILVLGTLLAGPALGQAAGDSAADAPQTNSMPEIGDLLKLADKATTSTVAGKPGESGWSAPVKLAIVFTILALLPSLLVMMTSFTRIIIVLSFVRRALSTQAVPDDLHHGLHPGKDQPGSYPALS